MLASRYPTAFVPVKGNWPDAAGAGTTTVNAAVKVSVPQVARTVCAPGVAFVGTLMVAAKLPDASALVVVNTTGVDSKLRVTVLWAGQPSPVTWTVWPGTAMLVDNWSPIAGGG
jgi:hypothetical protein